MRILLTIHHPLTTNGGAAGVTVRLAEEYRRLGHDVRVLSFDDMPRHLPESAKLAIFPFFVARRVATMRAKWQPDVIDASTADAWVLALRRQEGDPVLVTRSHGLEHTAHQAVLAEARAGAVALSWKYPLYRGGLHLWEVAASMRRSDGVLLLNQLDHTYAREHLHLGPARGRVVANGVPDAFLGRPLTPTPMDPEAPVGIAQVGSYILEKGVRYSAQALGSLLARYPQAHAAFIGTGCPAERVLADYPEALHERIRVIPRFENDLLPLLLERYQIKLLPSIREGFSLALIEAMACGLAPVTSRNGGSLEVIADGENGFLLPLGDAAAAERALSRLIEDRVLLDRLRRRALDDAQRYSWRAIARETLDYYRALTATRDGRAKDSGRVHEARAA